MVYGKQAIVRQEPDAVRGRAIRSRRLHCAQSHGAMTADPAAMGRLYLAAVMGLAATQIVAVHMPVRSTVGWQVTLAS